ncbi:MAG: CBS domain-containing protein [Chthoniobacterales bacterium]
MKPARELMNPRVVRLPGAMSLREFSDALPSHPEDICFVVDDGKRIAGVITMEAALKAIGQPGGATILSEVASADYAIVTTETSVFEIITKMRLDETHIFLVTPASSSGPPGKFEGWISKTTIADSLIDAIELFAD